MLSESERERDSSSMPYKIQINPYFFATARIYALYGMMLSRAYRLGTGGRYCMIVYQDCIPISCVHVSQPATISSQKIAMMIEIDNRRRSHVPSSSLSCQPESSSN